MNNRVNVRPAVVTGPTGEQLTLSTLPPRDTTRWTARRKAEVVAAIEGGLITLDEACDWYRLSAEEFAHWQDASHHGGMPALRATYAQQLRRRIPRAIAA